MSRKYIALIMALLMVVTSLPIAIFGATVSGKCGTKVNYTLSDDGILSIQGSGKMYDMTGSTVPWYENRERINKVIISEGVTNIGTAAFADCINLTSVGIPDSVTSIGYHAFNGCGKLVDINIPYGVTSIGWYTFNECTSLSNIEIPDSVDFIGGWAFYNCRNLTSVSLPANLTVINESVFRGCNKIEEITFYNKVTSIGMGAFSGCSSLSDVYYYGSQMQWNLIVMDLFNECLTSAALHIEGSVDGNDNLIVVKDGKCGDNVNYKLYNDGSLVIDGKGDIYDFSDDGAPWYAERDHIYSVEIKSGVKRIGRAAFLGCMKMNRIVLYDGLHSIGTQAFSFCHGLESIDLPESVTSIESYAFCGSGLRSIVIPDGIQRIEECAFYQCVNLIDVTIPKSVKSFGTYAFYQTPWLTSHGNAVVVDGILIFYLGEEDTYVVPKGVTEISSGAFHSNMNLKKLVIENDVINIGELICYDCYNLEEVVIGDKIKSIGGRSFENCKKLTSVSIGSDVNKIEDGVFSSCDNLEDVHYNNTYAKWKQIDCGFGNAPFLNANLTTIDSVSGACGFDVNYTIYDDEEVVISGNGPMADFDGDTPWGIDIKSVVIEDGVTRIGNKAFYNCKKLTSATVPKSVTSVGTLAFNGCNKLTVSCYKNSVMATVAKENGLGVEYLHNPNSITLSIDPNLINDITEAIADLLNGNSEVNDFSNTGLSKALTGTVFEDETAVIMTTVKNIKKASDGVIITFDVTPIVDTHKGNMDVSDSVNGQEITIRLPLTSDFSGTVVVEHEGDKTMYYEVQYSDDGKPYIELTTTHFSEFTVSDGSIDMGDFNGDKQLTIEDVAVYSQALATNTFTEEQRKVADYNRDGIIDVNDAIDLRNAIEDGGAMKWKTVIKKYVGLY